jgi:hypothetical protein
VKYERIKGHSAVYARNVLSDRIRIVGKIRYMYIAILCWKAVVMLTGLYKHFGKLHEIPETQFMFIHGLYV